MSRFTIMFALLLFFSSQTFAGDLHAAFAVDPKGDAAGFVKMAEEFDALAVGILGDASPEVSLLQSTFAGTQSGIIFWVVQFNDLAHMAASEAKLAASKEAVALQQKINETYPPVSASIAQQLLYVPGQTGSFQLVFVTDSKADPAGLVALTKRAAALDAKLSGNNPPTIRVLQEMFAGTQSGMLFTVVEFESMEAYAKAQEQHDASQEWAALFKEIGQKYPTVSAEIVTQLSSRSGK